MGITASSQEVERVELAPAAALFRSLGDPTRLAIVRRLATGPARVTDLVDAVGLAQSTVSKHPWLPAQVRPGGFRAGGAGLAVSADPARPDRRVDVGRGGAAGHRSGGGLVPDLRRAQSRHGADALTAGPRR